MQYIIADQNEMTRLQQQHNEIQKEIAAALRRRADIEEEKLKIEAEKVAAMKERNEIEVRKVEALNNIAKSMNNTILMSTAYE